VPSMSSWRKSAHSGDTPSLMLSNARRMSHEGTRQPVCVSSAVSRASTNSNDALSVQCLARKPCRDGSSMSCDFQAVRLRWVRMLDHSLYHTSMRQMGRRSSMLVSSSVFGRGIAIVVSNRMGCVSARACTTFWIWLYVGPLEGYSGDGMRMLSCQMLCSFCGI
jgi:hypothetical protein